MPCQSYEDPRDSANEREIRDRLARIACKALTQLEELGDKGGLEFLLLKDREVADWWREHKEADRQEQEKQRVLEERRRIRESALAKLSKEERRVLGIK